VYYFNAYKLFPYFKNIDSDFMKLKSRYCSENPWYYAVFSPTEIHTFQTRLEKGP